MLKGKHWHLAGNNINCKHGSAGLPWGIFNGNMFNRPPLLVRAISGFMAGLPAGKTRPILLIPLPFFAFRCSMTLFSRNSHKKYHYGNAAAELCRTAGPSAAARPGLSWEL